MRIYWMSRHDPLSAQLVELERLAGQSVEIIRDDQVVGSGDELVERYRRSGCDDLVVVAPLSVIALATQRGVRPLWAEMRVVDQLTNPARQVRAAGRVYEFVRFRRIAAVELRYDDDVILGQPGGPSRR